MSSRREDSPDCDRRDSVCYFCNESIEEGQLQGHLKHCGSILEQCPLRCGAWIQRRHKASHARDCPQGGGRRRSTPPTSHAKPLEPSPVQEAHTWKPQPTPLASCIQFLEKEVASIRVILQDSANHREIHSSEIQTLNTKFCLAEERARHFIGTLHTLRNSLDDEAERNANVTAQFKHDISNIQLALQELQSAQMSTSLRLEGVASSLAREQNERELLERVLEQHEHKMKLVHSLENAIEYLKRTVSEHRARDADERAALSAELAEARISSQQLSQLTAVRFDLQQQAAASEYQTLERIAGVELAAKQTRIEAEEQDAKIYTLSRDLRALSKSYMKLKAELAEFKSNVTFRPQCDLGSDNGELIWRIENYSSKMKEARESGVVLTGPLFRTSKYGYTLKPEIHLNGIGKWQGRHITATVRLVAGPYDPLLAWPCNVNINIILKDQAGKRSEAMDIVKSLQLRHKTTNKKQDHEEDHSRSMDSLHDKTNLQMKRQYVFITHASLDKFDYVVNDTVFFEFVANTYGCVFLGDVWNTGMCVY